MWPNVLLRRGDDVDDDDDVSEEFMVVGIWIMQRLRFIFVSELELMERRMTRIILREEEDVPLR